MPLVAALLLAASVGRPAPEWQLSAWVNSAPLTLASLRGQPVLVRFWTTGCPFCRAAAPVLNGLHRDLSPRGLRIVGVYHPKPHPEAVARETVAEAARRLGFQFPVAADPEWRTLRAWWLDVSPSGWTSVTFLLDREGRIAWVHPGGAYSEEEAAELRRRCEELL